MLAQFGYGTYCQGGLELGVLYGGDLFSLYSFGVEKYFFRVAEITSGNGYFDR